MDTVSQAPLTRSGSPTSPRPLATWWSSATIASIFASSASQFLSFWMHAWHRITLHCWGVLAGLCVVCEQTSSPAAPNTLPQAKKLLAANSDPDPTTTSHSCWLMVVGIHRLSRNLKNQVAPQARGRIALTSQRRQRRTTHPNAGQRRLGAPSALAALRVGLGASPRRDSRQGLQLTPQD